jgi:hypothetical protein
MRHFVVFTDCRDGNGRSIGGGYMHVDAATREEAADKAVRIERTTWGSPRLDVRCEVVEEE